MEVMLSERNVKALKEVLKDSLSIMEFMQVKGFYGRLDEIPEDRVMPLDFLSPKGKENLKDVIDAAFESQGIGITTSAACALNKVYYALEGRNHGYFLVGDTKIK